MAKAVLIVDDDINIISLLQLTAETRDIDVVIRSSSSGQDAIEALNSQKPDMLILDIRMSRGDGFSVLDHLKEQSVDIPVMILTNYRNDEYVKKSKTYSNVKSYVVKHETPMERVLQAISQQLEV